MPPLLTTVRLWEMGRPFYLAVAACVVAVIVLKALWPRRKR